ncbi:hypothetical protein MNQ98_17040 [Paenibacillus sp. N3/727]|uniref:hypothetical protein n=1 Tax=Paenibacillus sp. N3/727 TaxID=2925845 RepID=UPI001F52C47D|nr:hypothetical protein [Paenibacillus sp. N3/727]UNK16226.1 hypothetical protein MNQ98_17040 [Paenibacillus sp. N3/727]
MEITQYDIEQPDSGVNRSDVGENGDGSQRKKKVYFANGIVIWEYEGFTYELYQMAEKNFNVDAISKIIDSLSTQNK